LFVDGKSFPTTDFTDFCGYEKTGVYGCHFRSLNLIRDNPFHPWLKLFGFSRTEEFLTTDFNDGHG